MTQPIQSTLSVQEAWEPYRPTDQEPWDIKRVAHLHRRAGFGASWKQMQRDLNDGPDAAIERLVRPAEESSEARDVAAGLRHGIEHANDQTERLFAYWFYRLIFRQDVLRERMTLFWHNHFATSNAKVRNVQLIHQQNELFRKHALESFADLLRGILTDPAMLIWLDGVDSPREKPNENLARELLELFSLGVGNYTEADIRAAARALTGWMRGPHDFRAPQLKFDESRFDAGAKTFLGATGPWTRDDIVRLTIERPACANFICRKLYRLFINEAAEPTAEMMAPLAERFRQNNQSILPVVETILRSRLFFASTNHRQRIASPVELSVGLMRSLDLPPRDVSFAPIADACDAQGQQLFYPPNVAGWAGGKRWINSTNMVERMNWLSSVIWGNPQMELPAFDPLSWMERANVAPKDAGQVLIDLSLQGDISPAARRLVLDTAGNGDPDSLRKALQLIVHCPEYQLV